MENKDLKDIYNQMHSQGVSAWFSDGQEERETILKMGEPWEGKKVLEIGCGEGQLCMEISSAGSFNVIGIDYSHQAFSKMEDKAETEFIEHILDSRKSFSRVAFDCLNYKDYPIKFKGFCKFDRIVMQGVLEHLDDPFDELEWMIDNLLVPGGDVITSSPCFLNPRGVVWMTLDMLGAVMSKTDLHYLNPWELQEFCEHNGYRCQTEYCDLDWAHGCKMREDLAQRIPLALKDGKLPIPDEPKIKKLLAWISNTCIRGEGATAVYRIQT